MKKIFLISVLILSLSLAGCFGFLKKKTETPPANQTTTETPENAVADDENNETEGEEVDEETGKVVEKGPLAQIVTLDSGNLYFAPNEMKLKVNQPVTVNYTNRGKHTFTVKELGLDIPFTAESGTFVFTPTKTGTFDLTCETPGHKQGGMAGKVVVSE